MHAVNGEQELVLEWGRCIEMEYETVKVVFKQSVYLLRALLTKAAKLGQ